MKHRLLVVAGALVVGGLFGAQPAAAVPPAPELPTDIVLATDLPEPPKPQVDTPATDLVAEDPCWELDVCPSEPDPCEDTPAQCDPPAEEPPTEEPPAEEPPADEPADEPVADPSTAPADQPRPAPAGLSTPNRVDTAAGPVDLASSDLWLVAVPLVLLIGLVGLGAYLLIRRSERR